MSERPVIVVVEDDPSALASLLDAMTRRFGGDYRLVPHLEAGQALQSIAAMREKGEDIALVIADQWMPGMTGRDLLGHVRRAAPAAKRALLVDWGDREASPTILQGCAYGELHNYLYKPWSPAEVHLYPLISEFLAEWTRVHRPGMELLRIVGDPRHARSNEIRELLDRNGIPYGFYEFGSPAAAELVEGRAGEIARLPAVLLHDGSILVQPTDAQIMDAVGESPSDLHCDLAVVGAGPAGLTAAVYAGSEGLKTLVIERHVVGGQAGASSLIRNFPGFPRGISGAEFTQRAYQQAWLFGAKFVFAREAAGLRLEAGEKVLALSDGREIRAKAVVVATGAKYRRLGVPELEPFEGGSVFYTTFGDGRMLHGLEVAVIGSGNSAGQAVVHLAPFARRVTLLVRAESLEKGMSDYLVRQIRAAANVDVRLRAQVVGGEGAERLERISVRGADGAVETIPAELLFVLIGAAPHTDWLAGTVQRDAKGFIVTGHRVEPHAWPLDRPPMSFETSVPGVFAVGDARLGSMKRVASAVGDGAGAIQDVHQYVEELAQAATARAARQDAAADRQA